MDVAHIALLVLAGIAAGWVNTVAGGGSMLSVPALTTTAQLAMPLPLVTPLQACAPSVKFTVRPLTEGPSSSSSRPDNVALPPPRITVGPMYSSVVVSLVTVISTVALTGSLTPSVALNVAT